MNMWWKPKRGKMDRDLRPLTVDKDALQLSNAKYKKEEVKIYVEHLVSTTQIIDFIEGSKRWGLNVEGGAQKGVVDVNDEGV